MPLICVAIEGRGTGKNLFKVGAKRRRTKAEINDSRDDESLRSVELNRQAEQIQELQNRLNQAEEERKDGDIAAQILRQWLAEGKVQQDETGNVFIPEVAPQNNDQLSNDAARRKALAPNAFAPQVSAGYQFQRGQNQRPGQEQNVAD